MTKLLRYALAFVASALASLVASAGTVTYYHNDVAGNPVAATNEQGQVIWRESYRPYGERTVNSAAALDNKIWFTSRRQDAETGLVYMGARYYDPALGRFISTDPVGFDEKNLHSFNRYGYANNNPYRYNDPDGREPGSLYQRGYVPPPARIFPEPGLVPVYLEAIVIPGLGLAANLASRMRSSDEGPLPASAKNFSRDIKQEDLGINGTLTELRGSYSMNEGVVTMRVDMIKGEITNPLQVVDNMAKTARSAGATELRVEGAIGNERLYNVLQGRYGMTSRGATDSIKIPLQ